MVFEYIFAAAASNLFDGEDSRTNNYSPRSATPYESEGSIEYRKWLMWYTSNGGKVTHTYDYPTSGGEFIAAKQGGCYLGGYGAGSLRLVIPRHVTTCRIDERTFHDNVFQYDMGSMEGCYFVPQYSDCIYDYEAYRQSKREDAQWERWEEEM